MTNQQETLKVTVAGNLENQKSVSLFVVIFKLYIRNYYIAGAMRLPTCTYLLCIGVFHVAMIFINFICRKNFYSPIDRRNSTY